MTQRKAAQRPRAGRRPGSPATREAILEAARDAFARSGYDRTTVRGIAEAAGVDSRLVTHYFGSKQQLFLAVVEPPFDPAAAVGPIVRGSDDPARTLAEFIVRSIETEEMGRVAVGVIRSAASDEQSAALAREFITTRLLLPIAATLGTDEPELRASLLATLVVGIVMARKVVKVEPITSVPVDQLAAAITPVVRHYLFEPLD